MTRAGVPVSLLSPGRAAALLDEVIYERVIECIDLDRLGALEQQLTMLHQETATPSDPDDFTESMDLARSMIDRALAKLPDDERRYLAADGDADSDDEADDCELCAAEAAAHQRMPRARPAPPPGGD